MRLYKNVTEASTEIFGREHLSETNFVDTSKTNMAKNLRVLTEVTCFFSR